MYYCPDICTHGARISRMIDKEQPMTTRQARLNKMLALARSNPDLANLGTVHYSQLRDNVAFMDSHKGRTYQFDVVAADPELGQPEEVDVLVTSKYRGGRLESKRVYARR